MILGEGLEEIGACAFFECTLLHEIVFPHAVKVIQDRAFTLCSQLSCVVLGEGLEEVGEAAFEECTSLHEIFIPSIVSAIDDNAFKNCSNLMNVVFCDEIEEFGTPESMCDRWNQGAHEKSLSTSAHIPY